jgi:thioesterase domain-containing protein/acyl carrier protein
MNDSTSSLAFQRAQEKPADAGAPAMLLRRAEIDLGTAYAEPVGRAELFLADAWRKILAVEPIGRLDNFFELGGDSLAAVKLFARVEQELGIRLPPSTIIRHPDIAQLAALLDSDSRADAARCLVTLQAQGDGPPLFLIHEASGNLFSYRELVDLLGQQRKIYGLLYPGQDQDPTPALSIPQMAAIYVDAIAQVQAAGPYLLVGYSMGGSVAYEIARQLRSRGQQIGLLVLIDAGTLDAQLRGLQRAARKLSDHLGIMSEQRPSTWPAYVWNALRKEVDQYRRRPRVAAESHTNGPVIAPGLPERLRRLISDILMSAYADYAAPPCDVAIKLLRCTQGTGARWAKRHQGWLERAQGGVEVFDLPAYHGSALTGPSAVLAAAYLRQWCDAVDGGKINNK